MQVQLQRGDRSEYSTRIRVPFLVGNNNLAPGSGIGMRISAAIDVHIVRIRISYIRIPYYSICNANKGNYLS